MAGLLMNWTALCAAFLRLRARQATRHTRSLQTPPITPDFSLRCCQRSPETDPPRGDIPVLVPQCVDGSIRAAMNAGSSEAESLRKAKLRIMDEAASGHGYAAYGHPYYWSAFTIVGSGD